MSSYRNILSAAAVIAITGASGVANAQTTAPSPGMSPAAAPRAPGQTSSQVKPAPTGTGTSSSTSTMPSSSTTSTMPIDNSTNAATPNYDSGMGQKAASRQTSAERQARADRN